MRSGELKLPANTNFDPAFHLTPLDVAVDDVVNLSMLKIKLKASKTDQRQTKDRPKTDQRFKLEGHTTVYAQRGHATVPGGEGI